MFSIFKSKSKLSWRKLKIGDKVVSGRYDNHDRIIYGVVKEKINNSGYKYTFINYLLRRFKNYDLGVMINCVDYRGRIICTETIFEHQWNFNFYKYKPEYNIIQQKIVKSDNCLIGDKVVRGDDWEHEDQDDESIYGIIIGFDKTRRSTRNDMCIIKWVYEDYENARKYYYRIGPYKFDLYFYEEQNEERPTISYSN